MSATKTTLANEAMTLIRAKNQITDIEDTTEPNAKAARMFLDEHIMEVLEEFDWRSFSLVEVLGDITDSAPPPPDFTYRYAMPEDALVPRQVLVTGFIRNSTPIPFDVELLPDGSDQSILTNETSASLRFTSKSVIDNVANWPHNFRRAVVYRLAASLATAIKDSPKMAEMMIALYGQSLSVARYVDQSGRNVGASQDPTSIRRRRGNLA